MFANMSGRLSDNVVLNLRIHFSDNPGEGNTVQAATASLDFIKWKVVLIKYTFSIC